tara:strand:- start:3330 stop:3839 length:510 start_codon:yes stop_codon:yes gene_type:complete
MSFIVENSITVSFADYQDVVVKDQRIFDSNEGLTDDVVEDGLIRATERILTKVRSSSWWQSYYTKRDNTIAYNTVADIPSVDPDKIKGRLNDFRDLAIYEGLAEHILPIIADFGNEDNAERQKMGYYKNKADSLLSELITAGDWYDFDGDDTVETSEKSPGHVNLRRVR